MRALVVFAPDCSHVLAGVLHRERRHVFCVLPDLRAPDHWIEVNLGYTTGLRVAAVGGNEASVTAAYRDMGYEVVAVDAKPRERLLLPFCWNNCVGYTKALLGLRTWAWTPHQLYRHLMKREAAMHLPSINLTLPGGFLTPDIPAPPPPPPPPPKPPKQVDAQQVLAAQRRQRAAASGPANVANEGGSRGSLGSAGGGAVQSALKTLTGR